MRVLILADGLSSHTERFVSELNLQGVETLVGSAQRGKVVDHLFSRKGSLEFQIYRNLTDQIQSMICDFKPDVVSAHFATTYGYAAARVRRTFGDLGARWSLHVWGSDILVSPGKSFMHKRRVMQALKQFDVTFADSTHLATKTMELGAESVEMIHWGCEASVVNSESEIRKRLQKLSERPLRALAPRPHEAIYRNQLLLEEIAPLLLEKKLTITVPQTGSLSKKFTDRAAALGVSEFITTYEPLPRTDYLQLLNSHHLYLSAAQSDSAPVSLIEAMAVGAFPIVAKHPGLNDLLNQSASDVCCFESDTEGDLRRKVLSLFKMPQAEYEKIIIDNLSVVNASAVYENNIALTVGVFKSFVEQGDVKR